MPTYTSVPSFDNILPFLTEVIISARKIPASTPSSWKEVVRSDWSRELSRLALLFDTAVSNPSPLNLFDAVFNFICAPAIVLGSKFKQPTTTHSTSSVQQALNKVSQGQERKAFKLLCSNGVAKINAETVRTLRKLHPERDEELTLPTTDMPQLSVDPHAVAEKLYKESADQNASKDVYGWTPSMFYECRGEKGFFSSFVNFACFLAANPKLFPPVCAMLLSGGALTPLHKVGAAEQLTREQAQLAPKLRPINSGSLLAKTVLSAVISSPAGKRAAERVAPFQLSMGTSRGVEKLIHICRAAYENKYLVGKNDFENGFNSLSRQKMLSNHSLLFPESTDIFNFFYGIDSPVFLLDEEFNLIILWSSQGSRQGCAAGTEHFVLVYTLYFMNCSCFILILNSELLQMILFH